MMKFLMEWTFVAACLFGWVCVSGWGWVNMRAFAKTFRYVRTRGEVVSKSKTVTQLSSLSGPDTPITEEVVGYAYEVDGQRYRGRSDNDFIGTWNAGFKQKRGQAISVLYDPENPSQSALTRGGFYMGLILFLVGFWILWVAIDLAREALA